MMTPFLFAFVKNSVKQGFFSVIKTAVKDLRCISIATTQLLLLLLLHPRFLAWTNP